MTTPTGSGSVVAIDVHVHVEGDGHGHYSMDDELLAASSAYFRTGGERAPTVQIAALYREQQMMAVIFTVDATTAMGYPALSSEDFADRAAKFADVLIPFGSVDPLVPDEAVATPATMPSTGSRLRVSPQHAGFAPDDPRCIRFTKPSTRWRPGGLP